MPQKTTPDYPADLDPKRFELAVEFMGVCYELFGAFLTAVSGLHLTHERIHEFQTALIQKLRRSNPDQASVTFLDTQTVDHQLASGDGEEERLLFRTTQGEMKANTVPFGPYERVLGRMAVTFLYAAWEDRFRERFANVLGLQRKSELKDDLFGDLGYLRNAAVHNHGIATSDVAAKSRLLRWFKQGEEIVLSTQHVDTILDEMDHFCARVCGIKRNVPSLRDSIEPEAKA